MSFALRLHDASMFGAARGRLSSFSWRVGMAFVFATGAALALNSVLLGAGWLAALCLAMSVDYSLGKAYLEAKNAAARRRYGLCFIAACAATISVFAAMTILLAVAGGPAGRVMSVLMSASSLVSVMLFLFQAPVFMLITAVPCTICLLIVPLVPFHPSPAGVLESGLGVACGIGAFLAYVARAAINNGKMFRGLEAANTRARDRAEEAEAKRAEAEDANRAKSDFLTTMTHELRTPLNAVIGYSEIIEEDMTAEGRKELADDAHRISASAKHLLGLIDQILALSNMDAERSRLAVAPVDAGKLVQDAIAAIAPQAQANNNRVSCRVAADLPLAHTDAGKLGMCVTHLLSNAVKFTSNGLIAVSVESERADGLDWLRIAISDTGIGMPPQQIAKAFEPFTQLDDAKTRTQGGMGLGLTITSKAAELLGGEVSAVSEFGAGSTFTLRVPMQLSAGELDIAAAA